MLDILFISNGHGEDAVAAVIASRLPDLRLAALPLVGSGRAYREMAVPVLGPAIDLPSGGWSMQNPSALAGDIASGLMGHFAAALGALDGVEARLVVSVGDLLPVAIATQTKARIVLIGCNKTDYYCTWGQSYLAMEIAALRAWAVTVLPRDLLTHQRLYRLGVCSRFLGNPMVDLVGPLPPPGEAIALLPGSRTDAHDNLPLMLEAVAKLGRPTYVALAPGFEQGGKLSQLACQYGAKVCNLAQALAPAGLALATAGTASEVAAAHGRPILAFPGSGPQFTVRFAKRQKELLGPAMTLTARSADAISEATASWLSRPDELQRAREAGRQRIGEPGSARAVATAIRCLLRDLPLKT